MKNSRFHVSYSFGNRHLYTDNFIPILTSRFIYHLVTALKQALEAAFSQYGTIVQIHAKRAQPFVDRRSSYSKISHPLWPRLKACKASCSLIRKWSSNSRGKNPTSIRKSPRHEICSISDTPLFPISGVFSSSCISYLYIYIKNWSRKSLMSQWIAWPFIVLYVLCLVNERIRIRKKEREKSLMRRIDFMTQERETEERARAKRK